MAEFRDRIAGDVVIKSYSLRKIKHYYQLPNVEFS